jgi:hypothetical protein
MSDSRDVDYCDTLYYAENLEFIYSTSKDSKNDAAKAISFNTDQTMKILNLLLLFMGIYITVLIFVLNQQQDRSLQISLPWKSVIFSGIFLISALIISLIELYPVPSLPMILPKKIYKLISNKPTESMKKIIATYLDSVNKMWIIAEKKTLKRQQIIICIIASVTNFILFGIYCIFINYNGLLNDLAIIISAFFIVTLFMITIIRNEQIKKLKKNLETE